MRPVRPALPCSPRALARRSCVLATRACSLDRRLGDGRGRPPVLSGLRLGRVPAGHRARPRHRDHGVHGARRRLRQRGATSWPSLGERAYYVHRSVGGGLERRPAPARVHAARRAGRPRHPAGAALARPGPARLHDADGPLRAGARAGVGLRSARSSTRPTRRRPTCSASTSTRSRTCAGTRRLSLGSVYDGPARPRSRSPAGKPDVPVARDGLRSRAHAAHRSRPRPSARRPGSLIAGGARGLGYFTYGWPDGKATELRGRRRRRRRRSREDERRGSSRLAPMLLAPSVRGAALHALRSRSSSARGRYAGRTYVIARQLVRRAGALVARRATGACEAARAGRRRRPARVACDGLAARATRSRRSACTSTRRPASDR